MNPVPLWFGIVGALLGFSILGYVVVVMVRERRGALPDDLRLAIDKAYRIQIAAYESGNRKPEELEALYADVRLLMSKAYSRDRDAVSEMLARLEEE